MNEDILELMYKTVPVGKKEAVQDKVKRIRKWQREINRGEEGNAVVPLAIAELVMLVWSPRMRQHAENVILQKAVKQDYLENKLLKYVNVLNVDETTEGEDWIIEDQDETIITLLWNMFKIEKHYEEVRCHREWIELSYERLKDSLPSVLTPEIIKRHDLTKFAFSQAVGYTLRFVHNTFHYIWKQACDLHLLNEPHHPQAWSNKFTPEQKIKKLEVWTKNVCEFHENEIYGINLTAFNFASEDLAEVFLLESYIDMVAVEWERKKGKNIHISTRDLAFIEQKYLSRYSTKQRLYVSNLITSIISSSEPQAPAEAQSSGIQASGGAQVSGDKHPDEEPSSLNELKEEILSLVSQQDQDKIMTQFNDERIIQLNDMISHEKNRNRCVNENVQMRLEKKASYKAHLIMIAKVVMEIWKKPFMRHIEKLVLDLAIEEGFIKKQHLEWIHILEDKDELMEVEPKSEQVSQTDIPMPPGEIARFIWTKFNMREHFNQMKSHREWVMLSYHRLSSYMPGVPEEVIERHDLSKFAFSQSIGYTLKWVHNTYHSIWLEASDFHLYGEPHHPQLWSRGVQVPEKQRKLEKWLCQENKYGVQVATLDLTTENMAKVFLYESFLDMVGIEWERKKGGKRDITDKQLVDMDRKYLNRYSHSDRAVILQLMAVVPGI